MDHKNTFPLFEEVHSETASIVMTESAYASGTVSSKNHDVVGSFLATLSFLHQHSMLLFR